MQQALFRGGGACSTHGKVAAGEGPKGTGNVATIPAMLPDDYQSKTMHPHTDLVFTLLSLRL